MRIGGTPTPALTAADQQADRIYQAIADELAELDGSRKLQLLNHINARTRFASLPSWVAGLFRRIAAVR